MESIRAKFERNISLDIPTTQKQPLPDEKFNAQVKRTSLDIESNIGTDVLEKSETAPDDKIPEIKDIYDYIYGNVQTKLEFYESKRNAEKNSKHQTSDSDEFNELTFDSLNKSPSESPASPRSLTFDNCEAEPPASAKSSNSDVPVSPTTASTNSDKSFENALPSIEKKSIKKLSSHENNVQNPNPNPDLLKDCKVPCIKCHEADFIHDRTAVLTEINANIKLELESVKQELKKEMEKNNQLNYEIANIESALETYHKEAKNEKSTLASIYSSMKNYASSHRNEIQESYTFKRIKAISDYMETLKSKLEHQDRIIKNNFVENPYYADILIKHRAAVKQLDEVSKEKQELKDDMKKKAAEELEIIKELNRQKFQMENKCKEIENYFKNEVASKEALIKRTEDEYKKQLDDCQGLLIRKDEEMAKLQKTYEARIKNYKQELVVVYRKWKEQKLANKSHD